MSAWSWVLIALCAAGALLAAFASVRAAIGAARLSRRLSALGESPFVTKLESLQIQVERLGRTTQDVAELERRARAALDSLQRTPETAGLKEIGNSWRECAAQLRAIVTELA